MAQEFRQMTAQEIDYWYTNELSEAFAENERKPLPDIMQLMAQGRYEIWGLFEAEHMLGYACLWKSPDIPLVLLDYLGVSARLRNGGLGSTVLSHLKSLGMPVVTESELPVDGDTPEENDLRRRRIGFYQRNGFIPAYEMATCGMHWQALLVNADAVPLSTVMRWHKELYGAERADVKVPIGSNEVAPLPYWMEK